MNEEEIVRKNLKKLANNIFSKLNDVEKSYLLMVNNEKNKQINELQQKLLRKDNIIKDIKEFIEWHYKDNQEFYKNKGIGLNYPEVDYVLDKIKELESK